MNYIKPDGPPKCCDGCGQPWPAPEPTNVSASSDVFDLCRFRIGAEDQERFKVILLDSRNNILKTEVVAMGGTNTVHVAPVDVLRPAVATGGAVSIICVHNHPSQDPTPSPEDRRLTERLSRAASLLGVRFLDHIIVTLSTYYSFSDSGEL